jgi:hypothetical protein
MSARQVGIGPCALASGMALKRGALRNLWKTLSARMFPTTDKALTATTR